MMLIRCEAESTPSAVRTSFIIRCRTANGAGVTAIEYELVSGTLYYRQTVGGVETSEPLIAADGDVQVTAFNVSRQTDLDGEGVSYTKTLTAELALTVGENPFQVTASVCPRRNISF